MAYQWIRVEMFSIVAFAVPVLLRAYSGDVNRGILIAVWTGLVVAVVSQFFEPETEPVSMPNYA